MFSSLKDQLSLFWKRQTNSQKVTMVVLLVAAAVLVPVLIAWATTPTYSAAFSGLSEEDASQIVQKMSESAIDYQLKDTGTILVPADQVYEVRLMMASEGLPQNSTVGYELFSGNTLGMTEFTQRVNYQRAMEGELERTIGSLEAVEAVRVHVVTPEKSLLTDSQEATTASITIQEKPGQSLNSANVRSITHLVASAVEGLQPENVVVVDSAGNLLAGGTANDFENSISLSDSQRAAEVAAAAEVKKRVQSMLDTILGPNHSVVQANVQMDWTTREVTSSTYDPTPAAVRSSQTLTENYTTDGTTTGGVPGAATNLPTPIPGVAGGEGAVTYSRSEETLNYEISQTNTKEIINPGQIKKISVSVMVDGIEDAGTLEGIQSAVSAAAGIDESRGDQIVVESMAFDHSYADIQTAELEKQQQTDMYIQIGTAVAIAFVLLALVIYFMRVLKNLRKNNEWRPVLRPVGEMALQQAGAGLGALPPLMMETPRQQEPMNMNIPMQQNEPDNDVMVELTSRPQQVSYPEDEQRARVIARLTEENPATVAEIIQIWLSEDERRNG